MRRFKFRVSVGGQEVSDGMIDVDQSVIDRANTDEFQRYFHKFDDHVIADVSGYHMIVSNYSR